MLELDGASVNKCSLYSVRLLSIIEIVVYKREEICRGADSCSSLRPMFDTFNPDLRFACGEP